MADFWIKVEKSTPDKPEIFEIASILNIDPDAVMGKLIRAWSWIDSNSENGHVSIVTNVLLDRVTNCAGFADAMISVGWLLNGEIPKFDRHMGKSAKKRANDAERKRKSRKESENCHANGVTEIGPDKSRVDNKEKGGVSNEFLEQILASYNTIVGDNCNASRVIPSRFLGNETKVKTLKARINEDEQHKDLHFWLNYFNNCSEVAWVRDGINGEKVCDFDKLINKNKFDGFINRFYG